MSACTEPNASLFFPIVQICYWLFLPVTSFFWLLNHGLSRFLGNSVQIIKLTLGRQELTRVLDEGQKTGLLFDIQRRLADQVFAASEQRITNWTIPASRFPMIFLTMKPAKVLEIARKCRLTELPVYESRENSMLPIGYVRVIDLEIAIRNGLDEPTKQLLLLMQTELPLRSTVEISSKYTLLTGMILMHTLQSSFGSVMDEHRRCIGFVQSR